MIKRTFDIVISLIALVLIAPILLGVAVFVFLRIGHPVLFMQERAGLHGRGFRMFKFRTMTDARDAEGNLLPDADRLTGAGQFLRKSSLDELPELWNILRGEMSLVGPRPLLMRYLPRYSAEQARRHDVRPGLTGLAQINGRNALSWEDKFALDTWYVQNRTFLLDLRILARTGLRVLDRKGISSADNATMSEFMGSDGTPAGNPAPGNPGTPSSS